MKRIQKARARAAASQNGHCHYCGKPMIQDQNVLDAFAKQNGLKKKQARELLATAEHLLARSEGGTDAGKNIVAAHAICNRRRHQRKNAPPPEQFRQLVQKRCEKGRWHVPAVLKMPTHLPPLRT
jgi:5-methylcytosine-specific restriction endonuclease McrA